MVSFCGALENIRTGTRVGLSFMLSVRITGVTVPNFVLGSVGAPVTFRGTGIALGGMLMCDGRGAVPLGGAYGLSGIMFG